MQYVNDPTPWTEGVGADLSIAELVANETIPALSAGALWWAIERGASLLTAGGPSGAGKTTLANACLSFLPDGARVHAVAGAEDRLEMPAHGGPTHLLVCELSDHNRPYYIAGEPARRVFALVRGGLRVVGTLHADSVDEAIDVLGSEVELSPEDVAQAGVIAVTRVELEGELGQSRTGRITRVPKDAKVRRRRIVEIGLVAPDADGSRTGRETVAVWNAGSDRLEVAPAPAGIAALARWAGVPTAQAEAEIAARAEVLASLAADGRRDPTDVAAAVHQLRTT